MVSLGIDWTSIGVGLLAVVAVLALAVLLQLAPLWLRAFRRWRRRHEPFESAVSRYFHPRRDR